MKSNYSPGIMSMLPLFYVGWRDSILSPTEMKIIHQRVSQMKHLTDSDKKYLLQNTDPTNPPHTELYKDWLQAIKSHSEGLAYHQKHSLAQLGADMARVNLPNASSEDQAAIVKAIEELEHAMGLDEPLIQRRLFDQIGLMSSDDNVDSGTFDSDKLYEITQWFLPKSKDRVKKLLLDPLFDVNESLVDKDAIREVTLDRLKEIATQGLGSISYPTELGGKDDIGSYMVGFEMLSQHDLSLAVKYGVQFGLFGGAILNLGTKSHHETYLPKTGSGTYLGCFAMTETGHGSNVKDLETTAIYNNDTDTITINSPTETAGKEYIGNALHAHLAVVFSQLIVEGQNHGIHAVVVPIRDEGGHLLPGIRVADCGYKMGLNGVDNGRIWFDQIVVPKANLLNRFGDIDAMGKYISPIENDNKRFFTMLGTLVGGRICVGLGALSASKTALSVALNYALRRRQFAAKDGAMENLIIDYPTHQYRLVPKLIKTMVLHNALSFLAAEFASKPDEKAIRKIETKAAGLKALATWHTTDTIQECREACGGKGYLAENIISRMKADSDIFTTFEGDNTVLMQLVAKGLLTEFNQSFHDEGFSAVFRYIGGKIQFRLSEYNPYFTRNTSVEHIESDDFLSDALKYREKKTLIALADRMKSYIDKRMTPNDAFLKCQMHMIDAAKAYIERVAYRMMDRRLAQIAECPEKEIYIAIKKTYALSVIMENRYWYLENDYMEGSKTKAIRRVYDKYITSFRKDIPSLVDALGINEKQFTIKP